MNFYAHVPEFLFLNSGETALTVAIGLTGMYYDELIKNPYSVLPGYQFTLFLSTI